MIRTTRELPLFEPETLEMKRRRYSTMLRKHCKSPETITISEYALIMNCTKREAGVRMRECRHHTDGRNKAFLIEDVAGQLARKEKV